MLWNALRRHYILLPAALLAALISLVSLARRVGILQPVANFVKELTLRALGLVRSLFWAFVELLRPLAVRADALLRQLLSLQSLKRFASLFGALGCYLAVLYLIRCEHALPLDVSWQQLWRLWGIQLFAYRGNACLLLLLFSDENRRTRFVSLKQNSWKIFLALTALHLAAQHYFDGVTIPSLLKLFCSDFLASAVSFVAKKKGLEMFFVFLTRAGATVCARLALTSFWLCYLQAGSMYSVLFFLGGVAFVLLSLLLFFAFESTVRKVVLFRLTVSFLFLASSIVFAFQTDLKNLMSFNALYALVATECLFMSIAIVSYPFRWSMYVLEAVSRMLNMSWKVVEPILRIILIPIGKGVVKWGKMATGFFAFLFSGLVDAVLHPGGQIFKKLFRLVWKNPIIALPISLAVAGLIVFFEPRLDFIEWTVLFFLSCITFVPYVFLSIYLTVTASEPASALLAAAVVIHAIVFYAGILLQQSFRKHYPEARSQRRASKNRDYVVTQTRAMKETESVVVTVRAPSVKLPTVVRPSNLTSSSEPLIPAPRPATAPHRPVERGLTSERFMMGQNESSEEITPENQSNDNNESIAAAPRIRKRDRLKKFLSVNKNK